MEIQHLPPSLLRDKIASDSKAFKDVYVFCKTTMRLQDEELKRVEEIVRDNAATHRAELEQLRGQKQHEVNELVKTVERLKNEKLNMSTQISNQQQMELEMAEMRREISELRKDVALKDERMNKRELREREIAIVAEKRVRLEILEKFNEEREKIAKELKIQNDARNESNIYIIQKLQSEIQDQKRTAEEMRLQLRETTEQVTAFQKEIDLLERDKKRLEDHLNKAKTQTDKLLRDGKKQLEDSEKTRIKESAKHFEALAECKKEVEALKDQVKAISGERDAAEAKWQAERKSKEVIIARHAEQNRDLIGLRDFFRIIIEDNHDDYIDAVLGEDRIAIFAKLYHLLDKIPIV